MIKDSAEVDDILSLYTTSEDVARPGLSRPWRTINGEVVATDGRVAIVCRNAPKDLYLYDTDYADDSRARQILQLITQDKEDANLGFRVPIPLDFVELGRSAAVAPSDARSYFRESWYVPDEECVDDEPDTPDDFARRNSVVVLPGARRTRIAAVYAQTIFRTVKAFGGVCTAYDWPLGKRPPGRRQEGFSRILFVGEGYDIILMPIREFSRSHFRIMLERSIADAATGRLVKSYGEGAK